MIEPALQQTRTGSVTRIATDADVKGQVRELGVILASQNGKTRRDIARAKTVLAEKKKQQGAAQ